MTSILKVLKKGSVSRHQKLLEEWDENKELLMEGLTFYVKYLGSCLVESSSGEQSTAEAIKNIVSMAKACGKKLEKVALTVKPSNIRIEHMISHEVLFEVPINRISYCSADAHYDHVFAFIESSVNNILECRAFLCASKKMAQAATLTISQAFDIAYDLWQTARSSLSEENSKRTSTEFNRDTNEHLTPKPVVREKEQPLIDFENDVFEDGKNFSEQNPKVKYIWDQSFIQLPSFTGVPTLRTNLCSAGNSGSALSSQFVVKEHYDCDWGKRVFVEDGSDMLAV